MKTTKSKTIVFITGSTDNIIPAHLNMRNYKKYKRSDSILDYKEFEGHNHFVLGQQYGRKMRSIY